MNSQRTKRIILALLTIAIWAMGYVGVRYASRSFSPYALTCLRFTAGALAVPFMMPLKKAKKPQRRDLPWLLLSALTAYSAYSIIMSIGARTVTASVSSFVMAFSPVLVPLLGLCFLKERMHPLKWVSVGVGALGVCVLLFGDESFALETGVLWVLLGALLFALYHIVQRKLLLRYRSWEITTYSTIIGAVTLLPFLPKAIGELPGASPLAIVVVIFLGVTAVLGYLLWSMALSLADNTAQVSNFMFLTPVITTLFGFLAIGELPPVTAIFGGILLLVALLLTNVEAKNQEKIPLTEEEEEEEVACP